VAPIYGRDGRFRPGVASAALCALLAACTMAGAQPRGAPPNPTANAPAATSPSTARACAGDAAIPATGVRIVRWSRAGCAVDVATSYRCAPRLDPIVVVDGTSTRRYLGGRFAVRVSAVPEAAAYLGGGDGRWFYVEPGRHGRLFDVDGEITERWLELPARPESDPTAFVLGDSIALGSADAITSALAAWTTTIDAVVGRPSSSGVAIAETAAATDRTAVVVELGTNDHDAAAFAANARQILRELAPVPLVVWVMPRAPFDVTVDVRRDITRLVARTPNGVLADWAAAVPDDALSSDGVHLLPENVGLFADFLARPLRAWRQAVAGSGAASCAG
jgi:hypothetical protein